MDSEFVFDPGEFSDSDNLWILKYCLNLMSDTSRFVDKLNDLMLSGETGGDIDWGIHCWGDKTAIDYEVEAFEGYRAYMGPDEHGQGHDKDIEVYVDEVTIKKFLGIVCEWYMIQYPESADQIKELRSRYNL